MEKLTSMLPANLHFIIVTDTGLPPLVQTDEGPRLGLGLGWPGLAWAGLG